MTATRFDTLAYAKRLQDAGLYSKIAEAQAVALAEVLAEWRSNHELPERYPPAQPAAVGPGRQ